MSHSLVVALLNYRTDYSTGVWQENYKLFMTLPTSIYLSIYLSQYINISLSLSLSLSIYLSISVY